MKKLLSILFLISFANLTFAEPIIDKENCTITIDGETFNLYGKIKIVDDYEDVRVKIVDDYEDVRIEIVDDYSNSCGRIEIVDDYEDVRVKIVDDYEDVRVDIVGDYNHYGS